MYDGVLCCALSLYFSLSNTIHTDDKCFFARVIDGCVSRISDLLCIRFNHRITEQGLELTVIPSLHPLHTISRGKEIKYGGEILPAQKPHCLHRKCPACIAEYDVTTAVDVLTNINNDVEDSSSEEGSEILWACNLFA